jgi:hypothetical protein
LIENLGLIRVIRVIRGFESLPESTG